MQHSIVYFPDYAHANPYQTLLYSGIDGIFHAQHGSIDDARLKLQRQAWDNRVIFHLHWEDALYRHLPSAADALAECQRFLDQLEAFLDGGGLFLWTIHNRAPHDGRYLEVHASLCEKLAVLADQIHLHSYAALEELERDRALDRGRITVIPHGNYRPLFPNPGRLERTDDAGGRALPAVRPARRLQGRRGAGAELRRAARRAGDADDRRQAGRPDRPHAAAGRGRRADRRAQPLPRPRRTCCGCSRPPISWSRPTARA